MVSFGYNRLEGCIPSLAPAKNLRFVDFSLNFLSGTLPDLSGLTLVKTLRIGYNFISGTLPTLDWASSLVQLDIHANRISGTLPSLQRWPALQALNVYENRLSGSIPALTGHVNLRKAYFLKQSKPGFSGLFPPVSCGLLAVLDAEFDGSRFECPLPACLPARFHASCKTAGYLNGSKSRVVAVQSALPSGSRQQLIQPSLPRSSLKANTASGLRWRAVSSGGSHTCGLLVGGPHVDNARCWGDNSKQQCAMPAGLAWSHVSAGDGDHSCGLTMDHQLLCWGSMQKGTPGQPQLPVPPIDGGFFAVAAGRYHVCAITFVSRSMLCWGAAADGGGVMHPPTAVRRWATVTAGAFASCGASEDDGRVFCWGCNFTDGCKFAHGQSDVPSHVMLDASSVATGAYSSCALTNSSSSENNLACWGTDVNGEISFPAGFIWEMVSPGRYGSCGIAQGGRLLCWGMRGICMEEYERSYSGHCDLNQSTMPYGYPSMRWLTVSAGSWHACAIDAKARLWCWGSNSSGQTTIPTI
jgi:hypothetical protein